MPKHDTTPEYIKQILSKRSSLDTSTGCINWWGYRTQNNYGQITLGGKLWIVPRLSYTVYKGIIPDNLHVLHTCDNPQCINPEHLFLGTPKDNAIDKSIKGRARGGRSASQQKAMFSSTIIEEIKNKRRLGIRAEDLALQYKCHVCTIFRLLKSKVRR
jgi:hypothetical protein